MKKNTSSTDSRRISASLVAVLSTAIVGINSVSAQTTYNYAGTNGGSWIRSSNWSGGTTGKSPGVDANPSSIVDGATTDIAAFSGNSTLVGVGINFNSSTNTGNGTNSGANQTLTLGALSYASSTGSLDFSVGNNSTTLAGNLTLTGVTVGSNSNVVLQNAGVSKLSLNNVASSGGNKTMTVLLGNNSDNKIVISNSGNITISSVLGSASGATPLTLLGGGTGTLTLSGSNTYSGGTTVSTSTLLVINTAGSGTGSGNVTVSTGAILGGNGTISGNVALNGATVGTASNTLTLNSNLTTTGTSSVAASSTVNVAGVTTVSSGTFTLNGTLGGSGNVTVSAGASLVGNATITNATNLSGGTLGTSGNTLALGSTLTTTGTTSIASGVIVNVTGNTTVSSGVFSVNGTLGGAGGKFVTAGATLGGNGTILGVTSIGDSGTLAPGNSPGLLSFTGDLTFNHVDAKAVFEVNGTGRGTTFDAVNVSGALTYNGDLTVNFGYSQAVPPSVDYNLFDFATYSGNFDTISIAGTYAASLSRTGDVWAGTDATNSRSFSFDQSNGVLTIAAIPEPSTYAAIAGLGMVGFALYRRRRQHAAKRAA